LAGAFRCLVYAARGGVFLPFRILLLFRVLRIVGDEREVRIDEGARSSRHDEFLSAR
jgi:hypothetical protein